MATGAKTRPRSPAEAAADARAGNTRFPLRGRDLCLRPCPKVVQVLIRVFGSDFLGQIERNSVHILIRVFGSDFCSRIRSDSELPFGRPQSRGKHRRRVGTGTAIERHCEQSEHKARASAKPGSSTWLGRTNAVSATPTPSKCAPRACRRWKIQWRTAQETHASIRSMVSSNTDGMESLSSSTSDSGSQSSA